MYIKPANRRKYQGFTLLETLVALGISGIILTVLCSFAFFSGRSFAAVSNYVDLNQKTMRALDIITREIRQAQRVTLITADTINFVDVKGQPMTLKYYGSAPGIYQRKVMLIGVSQAEVLLEDCDSFQAVGYRRTPEKGYNFFAVESADASLVKMIQIDWRCYRDILFGDKRTTESVQTAKIVLRYNPTKSL